MLQKKRTISLILVLTLIMSLAVQTSASDITEAEKKAEELESKKSETQAEKDALTSELNKIIGEMETTQKNLESKEGEIKAKEEELANAKVDENNQYESMKKRIKYMYENGDMEFIEILCASRDIGEFLNNAEYISTISEYDRKQLDEFKKTVQIVKEQEEVLQAEYTELTELRADLVEDQTAVETLLDNADIKLEDLEKEIGANAALLEKLKKEAEEAAARAAAAEAAAQAAAQTESSYGPAGPSVVSGSGQFTHPCPGLSYVSSEFGEYRDPSDPAHKGMDFAANTGVPTYAAADGYVTTAGWSDSAGNWVVINHGNGLVTKYMHHDDICVSAGQSVTKGQQIGWVGTTGWSTGPHLHFQVELDGVAVNPRNYL